MDEGLAVLRDWALVSPSPRSLLASLLHDDFGPKPTSDVTMESVKERPLPEMQKNHNASEDSLDRSGRGEVGDDFSAKRCEFSVNKGSSRGGLVERIAARAGFHAPKLNTARVKFANPSSSASDLPSPYVTIPPGLSPTTLLDSPIFLANSLTQPSPTTGKLPLGQSTVNGLSSVAEVSDNDVLFDDVAGTDLFMFKPPVETNTSYLRNAVNEKAFLNQQGPIQLEHQSQARTIDANVCSPSHDAQPDSQEQKLEHSSVSLGLQLEDGYNWRKYGQKQVKGSEYPRSYYKCTHPNCQAKKKIERSHEGQITDIVYKGAHNHPKLPPNRRAVLLSSQEQTNGLENQAQLTGSDMWPATVQCEGTGVSDGTDASSHILRARMESCFESPEDEEVDQANHGSGSVEDDIDETEFELKRRKLDPLLMDMNPASRTAREPRIVVQTTSDVDVLDDGYRWRKYGQKVVKGNPNPRSYYKCTSAGCNVRKHVERASHDLKSVITTYEGRHNHDVPVARTTSSYASSAPSNVHSHSVNKTPEPYQAQDSLPQFNTQPPLSAFQPQATKREARGDFCLGVSQVGHENNALSGLGAAIAMKMVPQVWTNSGYQGVLESRFLVPKGDIKAEPVTEMGIQIPNMASLYQQIIGRMLPSGS